MEKPNKNYKIWLYMVYGVLLFVLHITFQTGTNDDAWFAEILDKYEVFEYLQIRYETWTSRMPIELAEIYLTRWNPIVWKTLNTLVVLLLIYSLGEVFTRGNKNDSVLIFMLLLPILPLSMHKSAGWIATTINYLWPITAGVVALIPLSWWEKGKRIKWWQYVLFVLAGIFGCFQEQMAAVLFASYVIYIGYRIGNKKNLSRFHFVLLTIAIVLLTFILSCPGNANRSIAEIDRWFPEFAGLSNGAKFLIGCLNTFSYYVSCGEFNTTFLLFVAVLFVAVMYTTQNKLARCIAFIPLFVTFVWGYVGRVIMKLGITSRTYWMGLIQNDKLPELGVYPYSYIVIECVVFLVVLCTVGGALFFLFGKSIDFCLSIVILGAAFCSQIIMGFSPTVYVSGSRTVALGSICIFVLIYLCIHKCVERVEYKKVLWSVSPFYLIALLSSIMVNT